MALAPAASFETVFEDSRRWRNITRRPGDIIISTPSKSGTTWMQDIVRTLLWPRGDAPGSRGALSPWVDARLEPIADLVERLEAMEHRRFVKTHSPGDCIPFDDRCRYVVVYRDCRDTLVSWANHRRTMRPHIVEAINATAAAARFEGPGPSQLEVVWDGDYRTLWPEWEAYCSPVRHLASWWGRRHKTNVLFAHYQDLLADLPREMRRLAAFLEITIDDDQYEALAERCHISAMRELARSSGGHDAVFEGGADAFYNKGVNGRWRDELPEDIQQRCEELMATLPSEAELWLRGGTTVTGIAPSEVGSPPPSELATGGFYPGFAPAKRPHSSITAIAEQAVRDARAQGLFDDLPLHGKPLPDIDQQRQPGWWANQFVARERNKVRAIEIEDELRSARPRIWRMGSQAEVEAEVDRLNAVISEYNRKTTLAPMELLDHAETVATWRRLRER